MENFKVSDGISTWGVNAIDREELKAEAVMWVKFFDSFSQRKMEKGFYCDGEYFPTIWSKKEVRGAKKYLRNWIKMFFNITEEDLK